METSADVPCPWCGQTCTLLVDTGQASQTLVTDCEVCCRPFEVHLVCEPGEILGLEVREG